MLVFAVGGAAILAATLALTSSHRAPTIAAAPAPQTALVRLPLVAQDGTPLAPTPTPQPTPTPVPTDYPDATVYAAGEVERVTPIIAGALTRDEFDLVLDAAGWPPGRPRQIATCIVFDHESGGRPWVISQTEDYGLFQLNAATWRRVYDWDQILDPVYNARAALGISRGGTDWTAWRWECGS